MHVIPVIDVRHGQAVHAVAGNRAEYRPLTASHPAGDEASSAAPLAVARRYLGIFPFSAIYVADLDGIEGRGANISMRAALAAECPAVEFWFDTGAAAGAPIGNVLNVVGSESLADNLTVPMPTEAILSLDFRANAFLGPPRLLAQPDLWPSRVIVMTLARVGTGSGPDIDRIADIAARAPRSRVYAAGGIRDVADLRAAHAAGAHGALVASALHAQKIKADDLEEITGL